MYPPQALPSFSLPPYKKLKPPPNPKEAIKNHNQTQVYAIISVK